MEIFPARSYGCDFRVICASWSPNFDFIGKYSLGVKVAAMASIRALLWFALCVDAAAMCQGRVVPASDGNNIAIAMITDAEGFVSAGRFSDVLGNSLDVAHFTGFAAKYKDYKTVVELKHRFETFVESVKLVAKHNSEKHSYTIDVNKFVDMTHEEFRATRLMKCEQNCSATGNHVMTIDDLPKTICS